MKTFNVICPVRELSQIKHWKEKPVQNTLKQLKSNHKGLNLTLLKLRCFPRTFITSIDYSKEAFATKHLFSEDLSLDTCFTVNFLLLMNLISRSFNICNFICSRSHLFLKIMQNSQENTSLSAWVYFQQNCRSPVSGLQLLLRTRHQHRRFLESFAKFKKTFFYGTAPLRL